MRVELNIENFEKIYNETYSQILKFIICKCKNLDDVNELIQDTYVELYKTIKNKKNIIVEDHLSYICGISKNILKKYYKNKYKEKIVFLTDNINEENIDSSSIDEIEIDFINKNNVEEVWDYLKKKGIIIEKSFYLYYAVGLKISEISKLLNIKESSVKNYIYRTVKELKLTFGEEGE